MIRSVPPQGGYPPQNRQYNPHGPMDSQDNHDLSRLSRPAPQQRQPIQPHGQQMLGNPNAQAANGSAGAGSTTTDGQSNSGGAGQEMNLASVLHYLQSEWRRWERDRNEWEIERAEMRARIALLEGQRRSAENLKVDLLRRVKMLEFALRQERTKSVSIASKAGGIAPSRLAALQDDDRASNRDDKEGSSSGDSEERDELDRPKVNGNTAASLKNWASSAKQSDTGVWKHIASAPKDSKARARSKDYLKQCLQEISYLTSPGALNPLPPRALLSNLDQAGGAESSPPPPEPERPIKALPERALPMRTMPDKSDIAGPSTNLVNGGPASTPEINESPPAPAAQTTPASTDSPATSAMAVETTARPPSSPAVHTKALPNDSAGGSDPTQLLTAIYRPESKAAWREELRAANESAAKVKARQERSEKTPEPSDEEQLASLTLNVEEEESKTDEVIERTWVSRRTLKSHLDIVRTLAFGPGPGITLASGGDDNTVKVWSVDVSSITAHKPSTAEIQPIITFRGHTAPVTTVVVSPAKLAFSASLDSTIRIWTIPPPSHDPYAAHDASFAVQTLIGHTEAVWALCLLPTTTSSKRTGDQRLLSASADGTVKVWEYSDTTGPGGGGSSGGWSLTSSFGGPSTSSSDTNGGDGAGFGDGVVPTCLAMYQQDFGKILVGLSNGLVKVYEIDTWQETATFGSVEEGADTQVNAIISHPTLPIIISGHEDGHLRFFDANRSASAPTSTILAHPAPITSLTLSPLTPMAIISSSTDCSMRVWDLQKRTSLQDLTGHRARGGEGVCQVAGHPDLPVVGSAGADGVIRLWGLA